MPAAFGCSIRGERSLPGDDFLDIYTYAKQKGLLITLFTNGALLTQRTVDHLAEWPPFSIEITLYGRTRETYERITGVPGSYDRCLQGIQLLKSRSLPLKLKAMVITLNVHEIWAMKKFAEEDLSLEFKFDSMINPRVDCSPVPLKVRLTPGEIVALDLQDSRRMMAWRKFSSEFILPPSSECPGGMYQCGGGMKNFAINPYGHLSTCVLSWVESFDLRKGSFQEGWDIFLRKVRERKITRRTKCTACQLIALCGMFPANAYLENQDPETPIEFFCQVAHLRAQALGISVKPHGGCEYCK
jgi:radical SAM protein with 4Fe4S-binding SPASM domain